MALSLLSRVIANYLEDTISLVRVTREHKLRREKDYLEIVVIMPFDVS